MITFPPPFVALQYPGYFWNVEDQLLYTLKTTGILRPLKKHPANSYNAGHVGYDISVGGRKKYIWQEDLLQLKLVDSTLPVGEAKQVAQVLPIRYRSGNTCGRVFKNNRPSI